MGIRIAAVLFLHLVVQTFLRRQTQGPVDVRGSGPWGRATLAPGGPLPAKPAKKNFGVSGEGDPPAGGGAVADRRGWAKEKGPRGQRGAQARAADVLQVGEGDPPWHRGPETCLRARPAGPPRGAAGWRGAVRATPRSEVDAGWDTGTGAGSVRATPGEGDPSAFWSGDPLSRRPSAGPWVHAWPPRRTRTRTPRQAVSPRPCRPCPGPQGLGSLQIGTSQLLTQYVPYMTPRTPPRRTVQTLLACGHGRCGTWPPRPASGWVGPGAVPARGCPATPR